MSFSLYLWKLNSHFVNNSAFLVCKVFISSRSLAVRGAMHDDVTDATIQFRLFIKEYFIFAQIFNRLLGSDLC